MITLFGPPEPTLLERLKDSVSKTKTELSAKVEQILTGDRPVDPELLRQLESALLSADIGVRTTKEVLAALRQQVNEHKLTEAKDLKRELKNQISKILTFPPAAADGNGNSASPRVLFVVGVNGTGKTTTIGKLAPSPAKKEAPASCSAPRTPSAPPPSSSSKSGAAAPASKSSRQRIRRRSLRGALRRAAPPPRARRHDVRHRRHRRPPPHQDRPHGGARKDAPHRRESRPRRPPRTLLVLDATTGQNGLEQARLFTEAARVTGIVLTKLDGTAKGGIVVAIATRTEAPRPLRGHRRKDRRPQSLRPPNLCQLPLRLAPRVRQATPP